MAEENNNRLPIKVVIPEERDLQRPKGGGSTTFFAKVTPTFRQHLQRQLDQVQGFFSGAFERKGLPAVARVKLQTDAIAKSHRPSDLLSGKTCPIIGAEDFGNLLISATPKGLSTLRTVIGGDRRKEMTAQMSAIKSVEPFTDADALGTLGMDGLQAGLRDTKRLKLRLFQHRAAGKDSVVLSEFLQLANELGLPEPQEVYQGVGLRIFSLAEVDVEHLAALAKFVGTQSVRPFSAFRLLNQYLPAGPLSEGRFPPPITDHPYPVVGVIDSGTDPNNAALKPWVVDRDDRDVPPADQDTSHGTFVAGLIANSRSLNHGDARFPGAQSKVLDVVAVPNSRTPVYEDQLFETIARALREHPDVRVWNLSLSNVADVCHDDHFSTFAVALDRLQEEHDVTFVICAGNYETPPFRGWPAESSINGDRVYPPADSIYGLAVGSVAHRHNASSRVKEGEPSPFSRRGPGAAYLPKPEVCHLGGNCDKDGNYSQVGVLSLHGGGNMAEAIGTSFSTPLVSTLLANIQAGVAGGMSRRLAKALLIHSAVLNSEPASASTLPYLGFGVPGEITDVLSCAPWQATLILEPEFQPHRRILAKADFPIPQCFRLKNGAVAGEFVVTLVYDPPRDPAAGAEYCRTNVDVSLGTYGMKDGVMAHKGQLPIEPVDHKELFEQYQIRHGFKWSPVKVYRRSMQRVKGDRWRLYLRLYHRSPLEADVPQKVALVITMFDRDKKKPVYNDVVRAMASAGWITQDLRVDEKIRARART